ncbi:MAG: hypothetical protein NC177_01050 [Ruminococcus flavefaciens]|nr:hypothetical protein [Ruminococcus flavefaciens]
MKKIIAMLAFTAVLCSCVSCGQDTADEVSEESSVTSVSEISEEETTEEITESETTTEEVTEEVAEEETSEEDNAETSEEMSGDVSCEEAIEMLLECINNKDSEGMMKLTFPDKYCDVLKLIAEIEGVSLDSLTGEYTGETQETVRLVRIVSDEPADDEYMEMFDEMYGGFQVISDYIDQNGTDNIDYESLDELLMDYDDTSDIKPYFNVTAVRTVICEIEVEDENGEKETYEQEFLMYYIDGEGWKNDLSMMSYVKKSKQAGINTNSSTIMKAANTAITELDEMDVEIPEKCIICSDKSKNYNVTDDFVSQFEEIMGDFFTDYSKFDYIIVINNGYGAYTACADPNNPQYIGTYPAERLYSADDEYIYKDSDCTLDDIYQSCLDEIQAQ